jgi:predicted Zn-dependent protease
MLQASFDRLVDYLTTRLSSQEQFTLRLRGEESQFTRFNRARVRQSGMVKDGTAQLTLISNQRSGDIELPITGDWQCDSAQIESAIDLLQAEVPQLPPDPYLVAPSGGESTHEVNRGHLIPADTVPEVLLNVVEGLDFTGLYAGGTAIRAYADSTGQKHWFATESYTLDYSLFTPSGAAVKGTLAGNDWDETGYRAKIANSREELTRLAQPPKTIARGKYRTYLAPAATADLLGMLSWGGISEASIQQGRSCFNALRRGDTLLSSKLTVRENFQRGLVPRFNELGEIAPPNLVLIGNGLLQNTLISARTAKEYDKTANGASRGEYLRAGEIDGGNLTIDRVLAELDTGLYLSNLHYLNWSDRPTARITGMTRYACFWVENGKIVAPIENLRFDETLYNCWGSNLIDLTDTAEFVPEVDTYGNRQLGGSWVPGMLIDDFTYTL